MRGLAQMKKGLMLAVALGVTVTLAAVATGSFEIGKDNDNPDNSIIQPAGETDKQHMENTDMLFGTDGGDLLMGFAGADFLYGDLGADVFVGGTEGFVAPNSDTIVGGPGDDINIWTPGDGSDAFFAGEGSDTMIFTTLETDEEGRPVIDSYEGRPVPLAIIDHLPQFSCDLVSVPASEDLDADFLVTFAVNGDVKVTVRLKDVEEVYCPGPKPDTLMFVGLDEGETEFRERPLSDFSEGIEGVILQVNSLNEVN